MKYTSYIFLLLVLCACASAPTPEGTWEFTGIRFTSGTPADSASLQMELRMEEALAGSGYEFHADGSSRQYSRVKEETGTWTYDEASGKLEIRAGQAIRSFKVVRLDKDTMELAAESVQKILVQFAAKK